MLVIPGVTSPGSRTGGAARSSTAQPARPAGAAGALSRDAGQVLGAPPQGRSPFGQGPGGQPASRSQPDARQQPIPMTIEPLDDVPERDAGSGRSTPTPGGAQARSRAGSSKAAQKSRSGDSADDDPPATSGRTRPAPRLVPGILGRFFPPPPGPARGESSSSSAAARKKEKSEDPAEPLSDAAVKRNIEKQVRETLGDRVRSVEVRVSGRNVLIVAQATRFWQRRTVRRSLEALPVLKGYRARIELDD
jgi:hypothetical protein